MRPTLLYAPGFFSKRAIEKYTRACQHFFKIDVSSIKDLSLIIP